MKPEELKKLIEKQQRNSLSKKEEEVLQLFEKKMLIKNRGKVFKGDSHKSKIKKSIQKNIHTALNLSQKTVWLRVRIAATIVLLLGIGSYFYTIQPQKTISTPQKEVAYITKTVPRGQKASVTLPDGSVVKLNSQSVFTFPQTFSGNVRKVTLQGEAYFEVVKNEKKPFIVVTNDVTTSVLGTTFNVEAYPKQKEVKVTLATGKVKVSSLSKSTVLTPSKQAVFNKNTNTIFTQNVNTNKYLEWKDGILRFEDTPLGEAVEKLEKWYNVNFQFKNPELKKCRFTGVFKNENLTTVLKHIAFVKKNMSYKIQGNNIILNGYCN